MSPASPEEIEMKDFALEWNSPEYEEKLKQSYRLYSLYGVSDMQQSVVSMIVFFYIFVSFALLVYNLFYMSVPVQNSVSENAG